MIRYQAVPGVERLDKYERPLLTTLEGGRVVVDKLLADLWHFAPGRTLLEILAEFHAPGITPPAIRAALACLVEAGFLTREEVKPSVLPTRQIGPLVSVVIVSYKSRGWLEECLPSLRDQAHRPLEIIVVDNGCLDDASAWLEQNFTAEDDLSLQIIKLDAPVSFARATNLGAEACAGEYLFFLNPDVRAVPDTVVNLLRVAQARPDRLAAVGAKLRFWWAPAFLNGVGNRVGPFSWGTDNALGHLDLGQFDDWDELPSACFAAILIPRHSWQEIGPADERFPMYYEDSEWSYRARLLGYRARLAADALVYHAFGGKVPGADEVGLTPRKLRHVVYGRMRFALKLVGKRLFHFLRNYILEDWTNCTRMLFQRNWASAKAYLLGWRDVLRGLPEIMRSRQELQSRRLVSDEELFYLQRDMPMTQAWHGLPELTWDLIQYNYLPLIQAGKTRSMPEFTYPNVRPHLLVVSNDVVDVKMAGPGMRYLEIARALSADLDVTLAVPAETSLQSPGVRIVSYDETRSGSLQVLVENADIALVTGYMGEKFPFLATTRTRLVVDLYDPFVLENLHYYLHEPIESQNALNQQATTITNHLARIGDYFICGNERQRDYWLGVLTANGRTNPGNFIKDPSLKNLIDVVGIGFPERPPRSGPALRGVHPAISTDSRIVLWGGGIWNWLDPLTLIEAWPAVVAAYPTARLVFLGTRHPNPKVPQHEMAQRAMALAEQIGEKDRTIIFIEWVSYEEREALLLDAAIGVTLHPIHVETRFSLRTRVLDYFWAGLPVLITDGDITSEWICTYGLGEVVPQHDPDAVSAALLRMLALPKSDWQPAFAPLKQRMNWQAVVEPLRRYCLEGGYAPDRQNRALVNVGPIGQATTLRWAWGRLVFLLRNGGIKNTLYRGWRFIQWKLSHL